MAEIKKEIAGKYDGLQVLRNRPSVPLYELVYRALRHNIISGIYEPGERLTEEDISKEAGVSRTPVREAFKRLAAEGLIEFVPNRGAIVTQINREEIAVLWDIRIFAETKAVVMASQKATDANRETLRSMIEMMKQGRKSGTMDFEDSISVLNHTILEIAGVRQLSRLYSSFSMFSWDMMNIVREHGGTALPEPEDPYINHIQIAEAIIAGNAELALQLTQQHLTLWKEKFLSLFNA